MLPPGSQRSSCRASLVKHAFVPLDHVIEDRLADGDPPVGVGALAGAADLRLEGLVQRVHEHDAAAVRLDPLEDQLHDPLEQLVDVQRVAHRQGGAVHDLEVAPRRASHEFWGSSAWRSKMRLPSCCVNERTMWARSPGSAAGPMLTTVGQVLLRLLGRAGVEHQRAAELELVAAAEPMVADPLAVDERAVAAAQVRDGVIVLDAADFGVVAGDLGVVDLDGVRRVPPQADGRLGQLEAASLIGAADDE